MKNTNKKVDKFEKKLGYFLTLLRRVWIIILVFCVICGAASGIISRITYKPEYTVTQTFTINVLEHPEANTASTSETTLSKAVPSLMTSATFMDYMSPFIEETGASGRFMVTSLSNTNLFYITVVGRSNEDCITIINTLDEKSTYIMSKVLGDCEMELIATPSTSKFPSNSPKYIQAIIIGAMLELVIAFALLLVHTKFAKTFFDIDEAEKILNSQCLAIINEENVKRRSDTKKQKNTMPIITSEDASLELNQSINKLSTRIMSYCRDKGANTIMLTSTIPGEGKTSICANVACNLADMGSRVLIVDCDLRKPNVFSSIDANKDENSLTKAIESDKNASEFITKTDIENLYLLGNTATDENAVLNANSEKIKDIINSQKDNFDYILLDTPPVGMLGDGISISDAADAFVYVISHNYVNANYVKRSLSIFNSTDAKMLGFVINHKH